MGVNWTYLVIYALVFVFSIYIGFLMGQAVCKRWAITVRDYWVFNLGGVAVMVVLFTFIQLALVQAILLGLLAGYIAGFKMSFGESVGPWKWLDKFMNVNRGHRKAAEAGVGEARRRRRKAGETGPDLISVENKKPNSKNGQDKKDVR